MPITEIKSFLLAKPRDLHIIKIETDAGVYGLGEAGCSTRELGQEGVLKHFREFLIGMDPMRIEHIWQTCYRSAYYEGGRIITGILSAIDMALYDIVGKKLGVPVYQLLGGASRDRVYGFVTLGSVDDAEVHEKIEAAVDEGWPAIRFMPADGGAAGFNVLDVRKSMAATAAQFTEIWQGARKHVAFGLDYHHRLAVAEAAQFCQMIPCGSMAFLEEPVRCQTPDAYAQLRAMTNVPFAIGEEWSNKWEALPYLERGLANYARLDVCCIGGLTEAMKVAGWCEAHYIDVMPHNPIGPVCTAATVHFAAAINNMTWIEVNRAYNQGARDVFPEMLELNGTAYPLPVKPGLGVELDEQAAAKYPMVELYEHPHLKRPDGSYTNW